MARMGRIGFLTLTIADKWRRLIRAIRGSDSPEINLVRQLIFIIGLMGEVRCELFADFLNAPNQPFREIPFSEFVRNHGYDPIPEFLSHLFMNPTIAQDDELAPGGHDKEEHAIAVSRASHAHAEESLVCSLFDAAPEEPSDGNADFT